MMMMNVSVTKGSLFVIYSLLPEPIRAAISAFCASVGFTSHTWMMRPQSWRKY